MSYENGLEPLAKEKDLTRNNVFVFAVISSGVPKATPWRETMHNKPKTIEQGLIIASPLSNVQKLHYFGVILLNV
jgi:hypothetical protein